MIDSVVQKVVSAHEFLYFFLDPGYSFASRYTYPPAHESVALASLGEQMLARLFPEAIDADVDLKGPSPGQ